MTEADKIETLAAGQFLSERNLFGLAWADESGVVRRTYGKLAGCVRVGQHLTDTVPALFGLEDEINSLRQSPARSVDLPNIRLNPADLDAARINLSVHWMEAARSYLVLVVQTSAHADLEVALAAQVRARTIAEAELAARSKLIARANEELARINEDLQQFAAIISHDLNSPLRALRFFAGDARQAVETGNDDAASERLEQVMDQSRRMTRMLSGLLEYSRLSRREEALEVVDTAALVREVVSSIARPPAMAIDIAGSWPKLVTLAQPLDIVLRNLLDNAVKHHDRAEGYIVVESDDGPDQLFIRVRDDGPGIPSNWHAAVFEPFRQISEDSRAARPDRGAGLGLTLVKKIADSVGGSIRVSSDPVAKRGTTFELVWPKAIKNLANDRLDVIVR